MPNNTSRHLIALSLLLSVAACVSNIQPGTIGTLKTAPPAEDPLVQSIEPTANMSVDALQSAAIENYRAYVEMSPAGPARDEAARRLAALLLDANAANPELRTPRLPGEQGPNDGRDNRDGPTSIYEEMLQSGTDTQAKDQVLYQLARAYYEDGRDAEAVNALSQLTQEFPDSDYSAEAHFRRAEMLFNLRRYADAENGYLTVLGREDNATYHPYARYKYGWSQFKQEQYSAALSTFYTVLDNSLPADFKHLTLDDDTLPDTLSRAEGARLKDTVRVSALSYFYLADQRSDNANTTTQHIINQNLAGQPVQRTEPLIYQQLADIYLEKERFTDAAQTNLAFLQRSPNHQHAPRFAINRINAYETGGFAEQTLDARKDFAKTYQLQGEYWQTNQPEDYPDVIEYVKTNLKDLGNYHHALAQESQDAAFTTQNFKEAGEWYTRFLDSFPQDEQAPAINFLLAEALFEINDYLAAGDQYTRTAYDYPAHDKNAEAAYAAILAYQKYAETQLTPAAAETASASAMRFAETYPEHPQAVIVLTRAAEDALTANNFARATELAKRILNREPPAAAAQQQSAQVVLANAAFEQQQYEQAEQAFTQAIALMGAQPADPELAQNASERLAASIYKQGEAHREAGDLNAAVDDFLRVAKAPGGITIQDIAEYDAAAALISLKAWDRAAEVLERFRKTYINHPKMDDVTRKLAVVYSESGDGSKAAAEFVRIANMGEESREVRREALWKAANLYDKANETVEAAVAYENYVSTFDKPLEPAIEAYSRLIELHGKLDTGGRPQHWQVELINTERNGGKARTERTKLLASQAAIGLADSSRSSYTNAKLSQPVTPSLRYKQALLKETLNAYNIAAEYNLAETATNAAYRVGELYGDFSTVLLDSPRPQDLSELELEQYEIVLEDQAYPFEEKAIETHEANIDRINEDLYDQWIQASADDLAKLNPGKYAKQERMEKSVKTLD